ncbi:hypothetical protein THAOC_26325 [Thalassiosira oceanica]|uniref:RRM domain-containing protein n=1 Tax=Thalassiosira oceanica TaxID=159749 RepID=K0RLS6_THAOC|nr:hypothetical protein THAOC_26325 [Thalassiosira oceanica]|eukprot:EJK54115.1 hypothetical protein THAOC_26325 [Thalassiosira oceanica]
MPSTEPSESPISSPSQVPSLEDILSYEREYDKMLRVSVRQSLSEKQMGELQYLYEQYTVMFGYFVLGNSTVLAKCQIIDQSLQEVASSYPLKISFTMQYSTKIGAYDISAYNLNFQQWMNQNLVNNTEALVRYGIPVIESQPVHLIVEERDTTPPPSSSFTLFRLPTLRPVTQGPTTAPVTASPSLLSTTASPSELMSSSPSGNPSATPPISRVDPNNKSFVLEISLGLLAGSFIMVTVVAFIYFHKKEQKYERQFSGSNNTQTSQIEPAASGQMTGDQRNADSTFSTNERSSYDAGKPQPQSYDYEHGGPLGAPQLQQVYTYTDTFNSTIRSFLQSWQQFPLPPLGQNLPSPPDRPQVVTPQEEVVMSNYSNLFKLPYGADNNSFSSGSDEYYPGKLDGSQDELDNYKNQDLEAFRSGVVSAVVGVEGMLSFAIAKALTGPDETDMPWAIDEGDANNANGIIEASCLCETYDWLKRVDRTNLTADSAHEYLQVLLNRIVMMVVYGVTNPMQGVHIVHACATILGLDLKKELPPTTLVITGMRKTNDLEQGHKYIIKAFKPFGKIEEAAISTNNRGFGFVSFFNPESVQKALKKFREYSIDIQDVSVSIKALKSELSR